MLVNRAFLKAFELAAKHTAERFPGAKAPRAKKASDTVGELWLYGVIASEAWGGDVNAMSVVEQLGELKGVKTLNIFINSPGGDVFEADAILTNLRRFAADKVVSIDGVAASAASFIAMAGDRIITQPHAKWMVHEASSFAYGRAEDMRARADLLEQTNKQMAELYAAQTGRPIEEMLQLMAAETWMDSAKALELGFTDEVAELPAPKKAEASTAVKEAAKTSPLLAIALSSEHRVALMRQTRRLEQLSRASPEPRVGQPSRPTP